jgi:hypothetical protein
MKLPNAIKAVVAREKIVDYLLNAAHPDNGGKADFFEALGFQRNRWTILATAFQVLAQTAEVTQSLKSPQAKSMLWLGGFNPPRESPRWYRPFGLWTTDRKWRDWFRPIRMSIKRHYDQGT